MQLDDIWIYNKYLVKTENNSYKPDRAKSTNLDKKGLGRLLHAFVVVVLIWWPYAWEELLSIDATLYSNIASPIIMVTLGIKGHNAQCRVGFLSIRERSGSSPNKSDLSQKKIGQIGVIHKLHWQNFGFSWHLHLKFSMVWTLTKIGHCKTTYLPRLVNVCERPLEVKVL